MSFASLDEILEFQNLQLENYGWFIHYVPDDPDAGGTGMVNAHTHGIQERFAHPDFQIVLPLDPAIIQRIFENAVDLVKAGTRFKAGEQYSEIIEGFRVLAVAATEDGRPVIRIIIPDKHGCLNEYTINKEYRRQWPAKKGGHNGSSNGNGNTA